MMQDYEALAEKISRASGVGKEEIDRKVEAKRAQLSGLISKEGAAQIVAAELGINFDKEKIKINELMQGMKRANVIGKIIQMFPVREYKTENREGKIGSFIVADETGNIRTVLWDTNHIALLEQGKLKQDDVVEITSASVKNSELHLSGFSDIKKSSEILAQIKVEKEYNLVKLVEARIGQIMKARAFIVQIFEPRFFEICPECKKKIVLGIDGGVCEQHGKVLPVKRALLNLVLDDGSETMRAVLFTEQIERLGVNGLESEKFFQARQDLLGKEMFFSGNVRQNKMFNNMELFVSEVEQVDINELIAEMEKINKA